jgi:chromosome segregation ATPase
MVKPQLTQAIRQRGRRPHFRDQDRLMKIFSRLLDDNSSHRADRPAMVRTVDPALDTDGRRWPTLSSASNERVNELEVKIENLSAELSLRCTQVADLYNERQQQAGELLTACDEIDRLSKVIDTFQGTMAQRDAEDAAANQKLALLDKENISLRLQLEKARKESADAMQRLPSFETALNDREAAIVAARESNSKLKAELTAAKAETARLMAAIEKTTRLHGDELDQQTAQLKDQIRMLESATAERDMQVRALEKARINLADRCDVLTKSVEALESVQKNGREKVISQSVEVLETLLKVERETAEIKIKELTAELQRERLEHSAAERASAGIRENIVRLLPKLVELRNRPASPEPDASISSNNAA